MNTSTRELARTTDPQTSHTAAAQLDAHQLGLQKAAILELLTEQPRDDHELTHAYFNLAIERGWPVTDWDSIRKRRSQLTEAGAVIAFGTHPGRYTRPVTVWTVAPIAAEAVA